MLHGKVDERLLALCIFLQAVSNLFELLIHLEAVGNHLQQQLGQLEGVCSALTAQQTYASQRCVVFLDQLRIDWRGDVDWQRCSLGRRLVHCRAGFTLGLGHGAAQEATCRQRSGTG